MRRLRLCSCLAVVFGLACAASLDRDWSQIGLAVAMHVDAGEHAPTAILDEYRCFYEIEPCRDRPGHVDASLVDATPLVAAFAEARAIPSIRYGTETPSRCPWWSRDPGPAGLLAEFVSAPRIQGDSARVELAIGCAEGGAAFEQIDEFVLVREGGGWVVVDSRPVSIT